MQATEEHRKSRNHRKTQKNTEEELEEQQGRTATLQFEKRCLVTIADADASTRLGDGRQN
jgi:hypothetical protein